MLKTRKKEKPRTMTKRTHKGKAQINRKQQNVSKAYVLNNSEHNINKQ